MTRVEVLEKYNIREGTEVKIRFPVVALDGDHKHLKGVVLFFTGQLLIVRENHTQKVFHVQHTACESVQIISQGNSIDE